ncbi:MAG: hypothetical protein NVS2B11_09350 [Acetobacteraceae bacterium]
MQQTSATPQHAATLVTGATGFVGSAVARALLARRSADQLRHWTRSGDVEPVLDAFATLGPLPQDDRHE